MKRIPLFLLGAVLSGCGAPYLRGADSAASAGNWEQALGQYQKAAEEHPESAPAQRKVEQATEKVAGIWSARGAEAEKAGRLGEAAQWWLKAAELSPVESRRDSSAGSAIRAHASTLEYFGDVARSEGRFEDAAAVYSALVMVCAERSDLLEKQLAAQRAWAAELRDEAESLSRRNLPGAALVADLRALQHDPLQPDAFKDETALRKRIRNQSRVALQEVTLDDHGYHAFGSTLSPMLSGHLADVAPYGPTRDPSAIHAQFKVTVLSFTKGDTTRTGVDEVVNDEQPSTDPVENPAVIAEQETIAAQEKLLATQQGELRKSLPPEGSGPEGGRGRRQTEEQKTAGLAAARAVDQTRAELERERAKLALLPPTVPPPLPPATWQLPWSETTRTVEATVRFEVIEPDFAQPVTMEVTHRSTVTDRTHAGNVRHHLPPDPLVLPSFEQMAAGLASQFDDGARVIGDARDRRVEKLLAQGRELHQKGSDPEALDAFVALVFLEGPDALPPDVRAFVARELENDRFKEILAAN